MNVAAIARKHGYLLNNNNGLHCNGKAFTVKKWLDFMEVYETELLANNNKCTPKKLAECCKISLSSAKKAIAFYDNGEVTIKKKGHRRKGVGSLKELTMQHHLFIYEMYLKNRRLPAEAYIFEFHAAFGIKLSSSFMSRWFHTIGPFKGTMRVTSKFPPAKYSTKNTELLRSYFAFTRHLKDHRRLVFADEKPMKDIDLYDRTRRDPITGEVFPILCNANSKFRYNILAAVTVKRNLKRNVEYLVLEENGDAFIFREFVSHLIQASFLVRGDIFVVDNCSIHMKGENEYLQETLLEEMDILMIPLPPYYAELNPTEFVFNYLVQILKSKSTRYGVAGDSKYFKDAICHAIDEISFGLVVKEYMKSGYLK